ncbi:MAG: non-ribosomal peptide synthetase, partial [Symploca sp. SIO1C4]|nr:non-ribosomal peptide synthetase [Symploca sp. SIO1C4]
MTTIYKFLSELRSLDVQIWAEGYDLHYKAPKGRLTPELAAQLREHKSEIISFLDTTNNVNSSHLRPILPVEHQTKLPLSFGQQRLWFLTQLEPRSSVYNIPLAYRLRGLLNVTVLEQSLREIVRRHSILRTTFTSVDGQPVQVISPETDL